MLMLFKLCFFWSCIKSVAFGLFFNVIYFTLVIHPRKLYNMQPENGPLEKEIPIGKPLFSGSMLNFGGVFMPQQNPPCHWQRWKVFSKINFCDTEIIDVATFPPVASFPCFFSVKNGATSSQFWPGRGWPKFQTDGWLGGWVWLGRFWIFLVEKVKNFRGTKWGGRKLGKRCTHTPQRE